MSWWCGTPYFKGGGYAFGFLQNQNAESEYRKRNGNILINISPYRLSPIAIRIRPRGA